MAWSAARSKTEQRHHEEFMCVIKVSGIDRIRNYCNKSIKRKNPPQISIAVNSSGDILHIFRPPSYLLEYFYPSCWHLYKLHSAWYDITSISQRPLHHTVELTNINYGTKANYQFWGMQCSCTEWLSLKVKGTRRLNDTEDTKDRKRHVWLETELTLPLSDKPRRVTDAQLEPAWGRQHFLCLCITLFAFPSEQRVMKTSCELQLQTPWPGGEAEQWERKESALQYRVGQRGR